MSKNIYKRNFLKDVIFRVDFVNPIDVNAFVKDNLNQLKKLYPHEEYILNLKRDFEYLANKYSIKAMESSDWKLKRIYPNNHPILRLSQITTFLTHTQNVMDRMLECQTSDDVQRLFGCEARPYWLNHYTPGSDIQKSVSKRIGRTKSDLLAINLVVQMQFALLKMAVTLLPVKHYQKI